MVLVRASGPMDTLNEFLLNLFLLGDIHIEEATSFLSKSSQYTKINETAIFETLIAGIEAMASSTNKTLTPGRLVTDDGKPAKITDEYKQKLLDTARRGEEYMSDVDTYLKNLKESSFSHVENVKKLNDELEELKAKQEQLAHFSHYDADMKTLFDSKFIKIRFGSIPKTSYKQLLAVENNDMFIFTPCTADDYYVWGIYCTPVRYKKQVDKIFSALYFERVYIHPDNGTVDENLEKIASRITEIESSIAEENKLIASYWDDNIDFINEAYSLLDDMRNIYKLRKFCASDGESFYFVGWLPASKDAKAKGLFDSVPQLEYSMTEQPANGKLTPPTKLRVTRLARPFSYFVEMYGTPDYGGIDITPFVAITYTILFGIMFGDLGQGFCLGLVGLYMWKKMKMPLGKILLPCGVSSMFFGLMFGSFFGYEELLDPLYLAIGLSGKPISVMDNINTVLIVAITIGIVLVIAAMVLNVISKIKTHHIGTALFDTNGIAGIVFYSCLVSLVVEFMADMTIIPNTICIVLLVVSAVILFLREILIGVTEHDNEWKHKGVSDFIMQNFFELLESVLSYFSNTVSFLRVGAFVLVHAGMMMVVFSLAGDSENIFVIILGNVLVIALEGLLTGIQSLRLEFYEMFSRCFEGSGKQFVSVSSLLK